MSSSNLTSPVGWYLGSYLLRFVELESGGNDNPDAKFHTWENTVLVKAGSFEEAHEKVLAVASRETAPYKGGAKGIPVQWVFEGITELLPIYEPLEDGAEIMWADHGSRKLKTLQRWGKSLEQLKSGLDRRNH